MKIQKIQKKIQKNTENGCDTISTTITNTDVIRGLDSKVWANNASRKG